MPILYVSLNRRIDSPSPPSIILSEINSCNYLLLLAVMYIQHVHSTNHFTIKFISQHSATKTDQRHRACLWLHPFPSTQLHCTLACAVYMPVKNVSIYEALWNPRWNQVVAIHSPVFSPSQLFLSLEKVILQVVAIKYSPNLYPLCEFTNKSFTSNTLKAMGIFGTLNPQISASRRDRKQFQAPNPQVAFKHKFQILYITRLEVNRYALSFTDNDYIIIQIQVI